MTNSKFKALLHKYNAGNCTEEEMALIESWYMKIELEEPVELSQEQIDGILDMQVPVAAPQHRPLWRWVSVAAAILVFLLGGIYIATKAPTNPEQVVIKNKLDVSPGADRATLTLATGKKIILDSTQNGVVANEVDATISKTENGQIVYQGNANSEISAEVLFNTITTPRGGQYHLILADGTKVWLNAASSITFPTRFVGKERRIEITGEVYFEVAHLQDQPFHVLSKGQEVEVLGTHFNINSYADEPTIKTTLLQGSVKVSNLNLQTSNRLQPGEQAIVSSTGFKIIKADMDEAMAWHNGDFVFNSRNLEEIMRTISRWYDVEIDYDNYKPIKQTFSGVVSRSKNLSAVIRMVESSTSLKATIKGKKVILSN